MAVLMLLATAVVWRTSVANREYQSVLRSAVPAAQRTVIQDRLVGIQIPLAILGDSVHSSDVLPWSSSNRLVWIVDIDQCPTCLDEGLVAWNALAADPSLRRHVLLVGSADLPPSAHRALRGTTLATIQREELEAATGRLLPNTKVLLNDDGTVLMADSRAAASECGWSFEAQVGALRGVYSANLIRTQPNRPEE